MQDRKLKDAARATPDPERSLKNLYAFLKENPECSDALESHIRSISLLFSHSQFLTNYCISYPDGLFESLKRIDVSPEREHLARELQKKFDSVAEARPQPGTPFPQSALEPYMTSVREFRMREILKITLRDLLKKADLVETMLELSFLADTVIDSSLRLIRKIFRELHGNPYNDGFSVIALGKLGGEELNFSSDVDLIFVYETEDGETSGGTTSHGVRTNRISNHEYYCKIGEALTRFLSLNTDSGFAYRVDLRLRPEGQRGAIALSLRGYEMYYESWGRAWERAVLLRARPVAGEPGLGNGFLEMIRPFVYRKYLDYSSIDEIRRLKKRIDTTFKKADIKRGYGGIREVEFFAQALQLIYGGREPLLRERSILKVLHRLLQKTLIGQEDYSILSDNYRYLRTLEHRLQQVNDVQTHSIPIGEAELSALARKMVFSDSTSFLADLEKRRASVRSIYDSLFAEHREEQTLSGTFLDEEFTDAELKEYLANTGLKDLDRAVRNVRAIRDSTFSFQTLRGRRLLGEILPLFVDSALKTNSPDVTLNHLQSFARLLSERESYLDMFKTNEMLIQMLTYVFSQSAYLTKLLMGRPQYLEMIGLQEILKKSLKALLEDIQDEISEGRSLNEAIRLVKQAEEIRLGLLFLRKSIRVLQVMKGLSKTAEAILSSCLKHISEDGGGLAVIGFGKLGGRGITFNSDLDIIFVCPDDVSLSETKSAEKLLRMLISYTKDGIAYRVDTRLRPDGSKGPLVSSMESFRKYYAKAAAFWEFQALLRARPVAGDRKTGLLFIEMAKDTLIARGREIKGSDIMHMRERILRELAKESEGYDIKLGPGGMEEIEFTVQYLQLNNCHRDRRLLVQGTLVGIDRLMDSAIVSPDQAAFLSEVYLFYRTLESFLRLRGEEILKRDEEILKNTADFLGFARTDEFVRYLEDSRVAVKDITDRYLNGLS